MGLTGADDTGRSADLSGRIVAHYERHAACWDADRQAGAWSDRPWHDRFRSVLPAGARVLDLGCGGGSPVAATLVAGGFRVTGVDTSASLIERCRQRMPGEEWVRGDMRRLALGRRFDGILAWDSFFHLPPDDQRRMFDVFAAHAGPGAFLMLNTGPAAGEAIGRYRGDPLYHASLDPAEYRCLFAGSGFAVLAHAAEDPAAGGRTVWLARNGASPAAEAAGPD